MQPLPIDPYLPALVADVRDRRGLVLVAEPGAGKTTRLPRALLDAGFGERGEIVVVQPRRIAARMAARRVAEELGEDVGARVGYRVRFEQKVGRGTRLTFVTEGILARRLDTDPLLKGVSVVVFDELHERHLPTDLALARGRRARERGREDLAIVAMSATLETEPVARFLDAPVHEVPGRTHPVEARFAEGLDDRPLERGVRAAVVRLIDEGLDGDVLVFLPGAGEIRRAAEELEGPAKAHGLDVVPLHGDLSAEAQDRAVRRGPRRKVILSTNVAETSLTIEGVVAVIDSGLARMARTSPWTGLTSLDVLPVSRASATQRAGRAGRVRPGVAVRLYTKADHDARPLRDRPEIERADLAEMVLSLRAAGEDPRSFPYLEPPPAAALDAAERLLERLGATRPDGAVNELGRAMLALPLHPRLARVTLEAHRQGHTRSGALLAALLGERDVRLSARARLGHRGAARTDEVASSDLLVRMDELDAAGTSASALRAGGLDVRTAQTVWQSARQIEQALSGVRQAREASFDEEATLLMATLAGFPDRVARRRRPGSQDLVLAGGGSAKLDPVSAVKEAELLVAVDAEHRAGGVWVRRASAVTVEMLMSLDLDRIEDVREARFDSARERVVGVAELRYDGLAIEQGEIDPGPEQTARALAEAALNAGLRRFVDEEALIALERRLRFARTYDAGLPGLDREWLRALLARLCEGKRSFAELESAGLMDWVRAELGAAALARLDALAPEHVPLPGRKRVPVTYEGDRPPWIAARLADFFGLAEGPSVAGGRVPLVLHLLAPNHRALQVTTDLAGFWERHYPELRRSLMRRYPRHPWPDDPRTASPPPPRPPR